MNIKNLKEGMVVKNYKELCELLGIKVADGYTKKKQLEELGYYCEYVKQGHKFIVQKINNKPMLKLEDILKTKNGKYINLLSNIILEYLYKNEEGLKQIALIKLFSVLGITNDNYMYGNMFKKELSQLYDIQLASIHYFYSNTKNAYKKIIERCLNNLQKRSVLFWKPCIMIVDKENKKVYKADKKYEKLILNTQKDTLDYLGYINMYELMKNKKDFKEFNTIIKKEVGFNYYFAYDITIGDRAIEIEYRNIHKKDMNKLIIDKTSKMFNKKPYSDYQKDYKILMEILLDVNNNNENFYNELYTKRCNNIDNYNKEVNNITMEYIEGMENAKDKYLDNYI